MSTQIQTPIWDKDETRTILYMDDEEFGRVTVRGHVNSSTAKYHIYVPSLSYTGYHKSRAIAEHELATLASTVQPREIAA